MTKIKFLVMTLGLMGCAAESPIRVKTKGDYQREFYLSCRNACSSLGTVLDFDVRWDSVGGPNKCSCTVGVP